MATALNLLERSIAHESSAGYTSRTVPGIDAIGGLEAKWPSVDLEAAALIVGRELMGGAAAAARTRAQSAAALRSEALGGGECGGPMASFGWTLAAATTLADEQAPQIVMAVDGDGVLRGVAPLARPIGWGAARWEMLGVGRLNEPADFVYTDREALGALADAIVRLRQPLLLGRMPEDSPTIEALRTASRGRAIVVVRPQASCPFITLDESWQSPEGHLSSRRRSDYRRAKRRAERDGEVRAEVLAPASDQLDELLKIAYDIEARSWKGEAGTALACDPLRGGHLRRFADWAAKAGTLRIGLLWIGHQPVAMQIATEEAGRWWLLKIGFDPAWADCSPGTLLLGETIRHAVRQKLSAYEFLGTVEPWTQVWTQEEHRCVSLRLYPFGLRGAAAFAADTVTVARRRSTAALQRWRGRFRGAAARADGDASPPASSETTAADADERPTSG